MPAIGLERDRAVPAPRPDENHADHEVDQAGDNGHRQAEIDGLQGDGSLQALPGRPGDAAGRDQNQTALETAGEIFDLAMPEGMACVGRPRRDRQDHPGHQGSRQVDQRLRRVGEQADRAGDVIGIRLEPHRQQGGRNRQPGKAGQGLALHASAV